MICGPYLTYLTRKMGLWGAYQKKGPKSLRKLYPILFLDTILTLRKKLGLILFATNMVSLATKEVRADQVLGPEFLVSFAVFSFSIDRYSFQRRFKCNIYGDKKVLRLGKFLDQLGPKGPKLA